MRAPAASYGKRPLGRLVQSPAQNNSVNTAKPPVSRPLWRGLVPDRQGLGAAQPVVRRAALSPARRPSVTAVHRPIAGR